MAETASAYIDASDPSQKSSLRDNFNYKLGEVINYYTRNRLYLAKDTAKRVENVFKAVHKSVIQYNMMQMAERSSPQSAANFLEKLFKLRDEIPSLLEALHDDFQKHLGIAKEIKEALPSPESEINPADYLPHGKEGQPPKQSESQS